MQTNKPIYPSVEVVPPQQPLPPVPTSSQSFPPFVSNIHPSIQSNMPAFPSVQVIPPQVPIPPMLSSYQPVSYHPNYPIAPNRFPFLPSVFYRKLSTESSLIVILLNL